MISRRNNQPKILYYEKNLFNHSDIRFSNVPELLLKIRRYAFRRLVDSASG